MQRIADAVEFYAPPNVKVVEKIEDADLVVHTVVGKANFEKVDIDVLIENEIIRSQKYAIIQCCFMGADHNNPGFWKPLWEGAEVVWSYLNLASFHPDYNFNFYYAPLGVNQNIFNRNNARFRDIDMLTTGYVPETEGIREVSKAVEKIGGKHVHIGPDFKLGPHSSTFIDISDEHLSSLYSRSRYVAGLRRHEGFELPAAEGLLCGARPIMFDAPHYRKWFNEWATFIPETSEALVTGAIECVLKHSAQVSLAESHAAAEVFDWSKIVGNFWKAVLEKEAD
jgi:hypothetical protein